MSRTLSVLHCAAAGRRVGASVVAAAVLLLAACAAGSDGADATWRLEEGVELTPASTTFTTLVSRMGCSSGRTGDPQEPSIDYADDEVVVTFTVLPELEGDFSCQGNDEVPVRVRLAEPLGDRRLVDGICGPDGDARRTAACTKNGVRAP